MAPGPLEYHAGYLMKVTLQAAALNHLCVETSMEGKGLACEAPAERYMGSTTCTTYLQYTLPYVQYTLLCKSVLPMGLMYAPLIQKQMTWKVLSPSGKHARARGL